MKRRAVVCAFLLLALALILASCGEKRVDLEAYDLSRPADEILRKVKEDEIVVHEGLYVTSGEELWDAFYEKTQRGEDAYVVIANYYNRESVIYLAELSFDGEYYTYHSLNGLDGVNGFTHQYRYLRYFTERPLTESNLHHYTDYYILVNDPDATLRDIQWGMVSSQMGDYIPHTTVYRAHSYK